MRHKSLLALISLSFLFVFFQNCSAPQSGDLISFVSHPSFDCNEGADCSDEIERINRYCFFNGLAVLPNTGIKAYSSPESLDCKSETRFCTNGNLTGSFLYKSCESPDQSENSTSKSCEFNGYEVAHEESVLAYLNSGVGGEGATCQSQLRVCLDGELSGTYQYSSCSTENPSCLFNGITLNHNAYVKAFKEEGDSSCSSEFRHCKNGVLSGSHPLTICSSEKKSCQFNQKTMLEGEKITAYGDFDLLANECIKEERRCTNGILSGGLNRPTCSYPGDQRHCFFSGRSLSPGETVFAYKKVANGNSYECLKTARTCQNSSSLTGDESYDLLSCDENIPKACKISTFSIEHGQKIKTFFFGKPFEPGRDCEEDSVVSTCNDGEFDKAPYGQLTCTDQDLTFPKAGSPCFYRSKYYTNGETEYLFKEESQDYAITGGNCYMNNNSVRLRCEDGVMQPLDYEIRLAGNIDLSTYPYTSCQSIGGLDCTFRSEPLTHNSYFNVYKTDSVDYNPEEPNACSQNLLRVRCLNGQLNYSIGYTGAQSQTAPNDVNEYTFDSCEVNGRSCNYNNEVLQHQATKGFLYKNAQVPTERMWPGGFDYTCAFRDNSLQIKCQDGEMTGRVSSIEPFKPMNFADYPHEQCEVIGESCEFNGQIVEHGEVLQTPDTNQTLRRYKSNTVPFSDFKSSCDDADNSAIFLCNNGKFQEYINRNSLPATTDNAYVSKRPEEINPSDYPEISCTVSALRCELNLKTVSRSSSQTDLIFTDVERSYRGTAGTFNSIDSLYKNPTMPRDAQGNSTCNSPDNVLNSLICLNGEVYKEYETLNLKDKFNSNMSVRRPLSPPANISEYEYVNCLSE